MVGGYAIRSFAQHQRSKVNAPEDGQKIDNKLQIPITNSNSIYDKKSIANSISEIKKQIDFCGKFDAITTSISDEKSITHSIFDEKLIAKSISLKSKERLIQSTLLANSAFHIPTLIN